MNRSIFKVSIIAAVCIMVVTVCCTSCRRKTTTQKKTKEILVWHWMTDRDDTIQNLAQQYKGQFGIDVRVELYAPSDVYSQKVRAGAHTNTLPDIYGILGESRDISRFVKAGYVPDMSPYLATQGKDGIKWSDSLFEKALSTNAFGKENAFGIAAGTYGIPIDVTNIQMLFNKDIFIEAGLDPENPPQTWEEFVEAGEKIKQSGKAVFVCGFGEIWLINSLASCFAINIMGYEKYENSIKGDVPYTDPDWIKVFSLFKEMEERGFFMSGIVSLVNKVAERNFSLGEAAFTYNGSWCVNVYHGMNPNLSYSAILPPKINQENPMMIQGGAGSSFFINSRSKNKDLAIDFLKWLTAKRQQLILANETNNLPSNKLTFEEDGGNIILVEFVDDMDKMFHPNTMKYSEQPRILEMMGKGIQSIIIREKTPEDLAKELQELKNRLKDK